MNLKKPKFWDYKKPNIYAYLLLPIAILLKLLTKFKKKNQKKNKYKNYLCWKYLCRWNWKNIFKH